MKPTPKWVQKRKADRLISPLRAVRVGPEDVLVFQTESSISQRDAEMLRAKFAEYVANPMMFIGDGATLSVLHRSAR